MHRHVDGFAMTMAPLLLANGVRPVNRRYRACLCSCFLIGKPVSTFPEALLPLDNID